MMDAAQICREPWNKYFALLAIDFSLNYTKLAKLAIKVYVGKSKISLEKMILPVGIEPATSYDPLICLPDWANLVVC